MPKTKNPVPVWKQKEQKPGPGLNLLKPFAKSDFPQMKREKGEQDVLHEV